MRFGQSRAVDTNQVYFLILFYAGCMLVDFWKKFIMFLEYFLTSIPMKVLWWIVLIITVFGAINWGLFAFDFNLVDYLLGSYATVTQVVYIVMGVSGVILLATSLTHDCCKMCKTHNADAEE